MNYNNTCPICFNDFDCDICGNFINIAITKCNHIFCLPCIIYHSKRKTNCPLCRGEFLEENIIENDLSDQNNSIMNNINFFNYLENTSEIDTWYYGNNQENLPHINIVYDASNITLSMSYENNFLNITNNDLSNNVIRNRRLITNYDEVTSIESSSSINSSNEDSEDLFTDDTNEIL